MVFTEPAEIFTLLAVVLILSSMGVNLYLNCGSCDNKTSKNLHATYGFLIAASSLGLVLMIMYFISKAAKKRKASI